MTYKGIEFDLRAGLGWNEWVATIYSPDASEHLYADVRDQGHRNPRRSNRLDARSHSQLAKTEEENARHHLNLIQIFRTPYRSASLRCAVLFRASFAAAPGRLYVADAAVTPTDFPA